MTTATQQLFDGVLLGDIVETMTGHDVSIERSPSQCKDITGSYFVRCFYKTRAYADYNLLGTAEVIWEGTVNSYASLIKSRMKDYLNSQKARPVIESYDPDKGILARTFMVKSPSNVLHIKERLFVHSIESLIKKFEELRKASATI